MENPKNIQREERNQMVEDIHLYGMPDQEKPEPRDTQKRHEEIKQRDSERQQERNRDHTNTYREQESKRIEKEQQQEREDERQPGDQWKTQDVDGGNAQKPISEQPVAPENVDDIDGRVIDLEDRMGTQEDDQDPGGSLKYGKWIGGGGGSSLTVEESDEDPSVSDVVKISFDKDFFAVTDDSDGVASVSHISSYTGDVTVMTNIRFSSPNFQKKTQVLTYVKGLLTSVGEESAWTTFTTAVSGCAV